MNSATSRTTPVHTKLLALILGCGMSLGSAAEEKIALAIHGGAGTITKASMTPEREAQYQAKLAEALDAGYAILAAGGSSADAVVAAVQIMEASPLFNAGIGAVYTWEGTHELDASFMLGNTREAGAVAGVTTVKSPIALARAVQEKSVHVMLSGEGAETFAAQQGLELVSNDYFNTEHRFDQLQQAKQAIMASEKPEQQAYLDAFAQEPNWQYGTVGAVARDKNGDLAAATSTGGMTAKRYGRIGDSPIIGAGTWADNESCAVSATGHGEYFIRYQVAADICARMKYQQKPLREAADDVIFGDMYKAGGTGGVIAVDHQGNVYMPFNTEGMYRASRVEGGQAEIAIYKD